MDTRLLSPVLWAVAISTVGCCDPLLLALWTIAMSAMGCCVHCVTIGVMFYWYGLLWSTAMAC